MSLWLQSLYFSLGEEAEKNVRIIFAFLAMPIPQTWWQYALQNNIVSHDSYIECLMNLRNIVLKLPGMSDKVSFSVLVALAFIDDTLTNEEPKYSKVRSGYSIDEYLAKANQILRERPDIVSLGEVIEKRAELLQKDYK